MNEILLCSKIPFGRLNRRVAQEQLDLLQFAAGRSTQFRACSASIMRGDAGDADRLSILPEHLPYDLLSQAFAPSAIGTVHGAKQATVCHAGRGGPSVNRNLRPGRHRDRADAPVLTNEIDNAPAAIALLDMCEC
jgi:hypothetical protein